MWLFLMILMKHIAIFNLSKIKFDIDRLFFNEDSTLAFEMFKNRKGTLFGLSVIQKYIDREERYDEYTLTRHILDGYGRVRKLSSFSSGQQKQLLLKHVKDEIKNSKVEFVVLDNPYDCMDVDAQGLLEQEFVELSKQVQIVQVFKIRNEVLPFINQLYQLEKNKIVFSGTLKEYDVFTHQAMAFVFDKEFPKPYKGLKVANPLVKFTDVTVVYEQTRTIVKNINWVINKGEFWHLKGPNGSGKTTLLTLITGDNPKAFGQNIVLFGQKKGTGETVWELKKKIGYFSPALIHNFKKLFTVQHMILSGFYDSVGLYQKPTGQQVHEANKWIDLIGLKDQKNAYFISLSKEMQRIILIARAMVKYPPLLILDEPTNELDDAAVAMLTAFINKIHKETETTILYVSHRMQYGLRPDKTYELIPSENGSIGRAF